MSARRKDILDRSLDQRAALGAGKKVRERRRLQIRLFREVRGVSGSTILDDGRVALILDVSTLLREFISEQLQVTG